MTSLKSLSDKELLAALNKLVENERACTLKILSHLVEIENRSLYLRFGYPSMFEYCTRSLGYSESSTARRLRTARLARRFPEVYRALERNELTVVTASLLSRVITRENVSELLAAARGKSQRDVQKIVAELRPLTKIPDRVIPVAVRVPEPPVLSPPTPPTGAPAESKCQDSYRHSGGKNFASVDKSTPGLDSTVGTARPTEPPATEKKFKFEFAAGKEFMRKFSRVQSLMSTKIPVGMTFEQLFESLMDEYLDRHDPEKRAERRTKRSAKATASQQGSNSEPSRHIPAAVRDGIYARDKGRCTFVGPNGVRCNATRGLQIDHIEPFALGGGNQASNLRLLCAKHNRLEAERAYGAAHMSAYHHRE
jgi:5-methylcytosine-specific restriction endonuclease McrA